MPKFISVPEAGRRLGRSPQSVKRLIAQGKLEVISIPGTHARVSLHQVEAYVPAKLRALAPPSPRWCGWSSRSHPPKRGFPCDNVPQASPDRSQATATSCGPTTGSRGSNPSPSPRSSPRSSRIRPRS